MYTSAHEPILQLSEIPEGERTALVEHLLKLCHEQQERLQLQSEQIQQLKDEIAVLKGEKPRPQIKSSILHKDPPEGRGKAGKKKRKRGKPSRQKTPRA